MFKKLKDKIAEEVKSSPSRIQQLAQVAQVILIALASLQTIYSRRQNEMECVSVNGLHIAYKYHVNQAIQTRF